MAYADVYLMGRRLQDAEDVFTSLEEQTNKIGLEINKKNRTKVIIVTQKPHSESAYEKLGTNNF